jgi:hypothetical protein
VATAPAVARLRSAFIAGGGAGFGEPAAGDHLQALYRFWLVGYQLEHGAAPWRDPYSFQPLVEPQLVLSGWPFGFPFWPLEALFGPVLAWNLLLLVSIAAAGLATFAWLRALKLPPLPAAAGGLAFAIAPYRLAQSGVGHLLGWIAVLLPLALFAFERSRAAQTRRARHAFGALAAAALVSLPLSGQLHLALGAFPLVLVYAALRFRRAPFAWALAGVGVGAAVAVGLQQTVIESSVLGAGGRTLDQVALFQADWVSFLDRFGLRGAEQEVYLGWLVPAVALAGLVLLWRKDRRLAALAAVAVVVPALLAVGTHLPTYELLWDAFPPMRYPRVPQRFLPIANLALAALVAVALAGLLRRVGPRRRALAGALALVLIAGDLLVLPLRATPADLGSAAYRALDGMGPGRTLELPIFEPGIHFGSIYDAFELASRRERPSGYSTLAPEQPYAFWWSHNRLNCGAWLPGDAARLRRLGVRFLLFHLGAYRQSLRPGAWFAWRALQELGYRAASGGGPVWLFPLGRPGARPLQPAPVAEPPRGEPVLCEGWKDRRMRQREAALWVYGSGPIALELAGPGSTPATVWVDGELAQRAHIEGRARLELDARGTGWHVLLVRIPELFDAEPPRGLELRSVEASRR